MDLHDPTTQYYALSASAVAILLAFLLYQPTGFVKWLQKKNYQYEVTFALYMMTPTEKFIFSASDTSPRLFPFPPSRVVPWLARTRMCCDLTSLPGRFGPLPHPLHVDARHLRLPPGPHRHDFATDVLLLCRRRGGRCRCSGRCARDGRHGHGAREQRISGGDAHSRGRSGGCWYWHGRGAMNCCSQGWIWGV